MKGLLAGLLGKTALLSAIGILILILLVWFAGPYVGIPGVAIRLLIIAAILIQWIVILLLTQNRAKKDAAGLEESLRQQSDEQAMSARPDRRGEINALRVQFEKSVGALKQSTLGQKGGGAPLYALPWYMFIGPPGSGKSTALRHSELQFLFDESTHGIKGVGGTRNCDWWFARNAVLLDTAGRYVTENDDRAEWLSFLELLRKYRRKQPINGVLAAISLGDLLTAEDEELEKHATTMRARIDELIDQLHLVFPVYVVFTKCDLVQGFTAFFEDLSQAERRQLWGATFPIRSKAQGDPHGAFRWEFRKMLEVVRVRCMDRLASAVGAKKVRNVYGFPFQLAACEERLARFVEILLRPNPYRESPIFRGFYFTSGTQEGTPIDSLMGTIGSSLSTTMGDALEKRKESKSYFINKLFTDVVVPDRVVARSSTAASKRGDLGRTLVSAAGVVIAALCMAVIARSGMGNFEIVDSANAAARELVRASDPGADDFVKRVKDLERVRQQIVKLEEYERKGAPFRLRSGLYAGGVLTSPLERLYLKRFRETIVLPARAAAEKDLASFAARRDPKGGDRSYSNLKAYLMTGDPARYDRSYVQGWLEGYWVGRLQGTAGTAPMRDLFLQQSHFYHERFDPRVAPRAPVDPRLVASVRETLREIPVVNQMYNDIVTVASRNVKPLGLLEMVGAPQDFLRSNVLVPGVFTREKGRAAFREATNAVLANWSYDGWVLETKEIPRESVQAEIEAVYFNEYIAQWQKFLASLEYKPVTNLADAQKLLEALTDPASPLAAAIDAASNNTTLTDPAADPKVNHPEPVTKAFASLHAFAAPGAGGRPAPFANYLAELAKVRDAVQASGQTPEGSIPIARSIFADGLGVLTVAARTTNQIVGNLDAQTTRLIGPLLLQPTNAAIAGIVGQAQYDVGRRWQQLVYEPCRRSIGGRYPFQPKGEEAAILDVAEFFHPGDGTLWKNFDVELRPFLQERGDGWVPKRALGFGMAFTPQFLGGMRQGKIISESLFSKKSADPGFTFDVFPTPIAGVAEQRLEVDGKVVSYRNGPQEWSEISWPGRTPGVVLFIGLSNGERRTQTYAGQWALFRLLDAAKISPRSTTTSTGEWLVRLDASRLVKVRYGLRARSSRNPLQPRLLADFRCPSMGP